MVTPILLQEICEEPVCFLGSLSGHQSMTGQALVYTEFQTTNELTLYGEVSWSGQTSDMRQSKAEVHISLVEDNEPGAILWSEPTGARSSDCGISVAVDAETVYAVFQEVLYVISRSKGERLWSILADVAMFQPVLGNQSIYVTGKRFGVDGRRFIRSLDASNGALVWEHIAVDRQVVSPVAVHDGSIFFTSNDQVIDGHSEYGYLTSLDASTGAVNWEYRVDS